VSLLGWLLRISSSSHSHSHCATCPHHITFIFFLSISSSSLNARTRLISSPPLDHFSLSSLFPLLRTVSLSFPFLFSLAHTPREIERELLRERSDRGTKTMMLRPSPTPSSLSFSFFPLLLCFLTQLFPLLHSLLSHTHPTER
jgi:hypothetical protein